MPETFFSRFKNAWNAFKSAGNNDLDIYPELGTSNFRRPDRHRLNLGNEKSIVSAIYTRIGLDVSSMKFHHVRVDEDDNLVEVIKSGLDNCLNLEANIDQTGRAFIQDIVMSMFDEGCVAVVPVDTTINPNISGSFDILTMRTGKIVEWYPAHVKVNLYNEQRGLKEDLILAKNTIAIIENPLYNVMNEPNSVLRRLIYKLNLLDAVDEQTGSGKLDLIISLPYAVKSETRQQQAELRRKNLEDQLKDAKYGIAWADSTEKITQLNRPAENNLLKQIEYLTNMLYSQLGLTETIFNGTADETTLLNYHNRTVEPVVMSIIDAMKMRFLTKTGRSQGQSIKYFRDPFKLMAATDIATVSDSFSRNKILTPNEIRVAIGYRPNSDPTADKLANNNLNPQPPATDVPKPEEKVSETNNERTDK